MANPLRIVAKEDPFVHPNLFCRLGAYHSSDSDIGRRAESLQSINKERVLSGSPLPGDGVGCFLVAIVADFCCVSVPHMLPQRSL
jgi:hypothetical protein